MSGLRDELAQAILDAIWPEGRRDLLDLGQKAAEAVLVLVEQRIAAERRQLLGEVEALRRHATQCRSRGTTIWVPLLDVQLLLQADPDG